MMSLVAIKRIVLFLPSKVASFLRYVYLNKKRSGLRNKTPSIISRNCFGGIVYHDLDLAFLSPTINLYFSNNDFFQFCKHLKGYLDAEISEDNVADVNFPVGKIEYDGVPIHVFFMHYKSFDEAKEKWDTRKKRVNYDNIYIIMQVEDIITDDDIRKFDEIPYDNRVLISKSENRWNRSDIVFLPALAAPHYKIGSILWYEKYFSIKRPMDDFDYVSFLNQNRGC